MRVSSTSRSQGRSPVVPCTHFTGNSTMAWRGEEALWRYQGLAITGLLDLGISFSCVLVAGLLFFYKPVRVLEEQ